MTRVNPALVRAYDLRGRVGEMLTAADANALGRRIAARVGGGRVVVGYDGRLSSPMLEAALVDGLVAGGAQVDRIGQGPTGMLYYAAHEGGAAAAVMVTGSHNPPDENGFKLLIGGEPIYGDALRKLVEGPAAASSGGDAVRRDVADAYVDRLLEAAAGAPSLRVGWDPGNGATGDVLAALVARLPGEHYLINAAVDGRFLAHHPDPSVPANLAQLRALVKEKRLDLGIAFDGDGDRIGVVAADGAIVWPDQLLLLLARDVLADQSGAAIVADVKSSAVLFDGIAAAGGRTVLSPSGYVLIRAAMRAEAAPLAGEMSGHIFFDDRWYGTDDALHVAMRLLAALARTDLAAFRASLPRTFATPELRLACPDDAKARILAAVAARLEADGATIDRTDGLRVTTPAGWWLLRVSGTEPKLTARVEAWTEADRDRLQAELMARLAEAGWTDPHASASSPRP